jgi:ATP-dependent HslUV protease, peptidase subunit HslV
MTTIVAVKKNGYVAIAADTLTTFGNTRLHASQDASHDKILRIGDSYVGVCGSAAHHLVLSSLLAKTPDVQLNSKAAIFETFRKLHPILKEECFLNPKEDEEDPYESSQITALIANSHGIFAIYSMREVFEYTQYWAIGSGNEFSLGAMHQAYTRCDDATDIAQAGVDAGIAFDKNSAAPVTLYKVKLD